MSMEKIIKKRLKAVFKKQKIRSKVKIMSYHDLCIIEDAFRKRENKAESLYLRLSDN